MINEQTLFCPPPNLSSCATGLENGNECFCRGNKKYRRLGKIRNRNCRMECPGDSTETCGGEDAIEVFRIKNKKTETDNAHSEEGDSAPG